MNLNSRKYVIAAAIALAGLTAAGQEAKSNFNVGLEGQVAVTTNGKSVFANMGGPCLKLSLRQAALGLSMFPSLKFEQDGSRSVVTPILGVGPQLYLFGKRLVLSFPCYYYAAKNVWVGTAGLGYVFTRSKT